jgi:hypothetical protein
LFSEWPLPLEWEAHFVITRSGVIVVEQCLLGKVGEKSSKILTLLKFLACLFIVPARGHLGPVTQTNL